MIFIGYFCFSDTSSLFTSSKKQKICLHEKHHFHKLFDYKGFMGGIFTKVEGVIRKSAKIILVTSVM